MIEIIIPGFEVLEIEHLILDYNGTIAHDGALIDGVRERLLFLAEHVTIHVLTADTYGTIEVLDDLPITVTVIPTEDQEEAKLDYLDALESDAVVAIGNGRNDRLMLESAPVAIGVIQGEGAAMEALAVSDVVVTSITDALDLLVHPVRLIATLRS